jgi:hypothetical protein
MLPRRRWLVPEVVQTSAMDCGPVVLKCLLSGYGIGIHYGRLIQPGQTAPDRTSLGPELQAALSEPEARTLAKIWSLLRGGGWLGLTMILVSLVIVSIFSVAEAILFRGILDLRQDLAIIQQRLTAVAGITLFGLVLMSLEFHLATDFYRLGRRLEIALRIEFLSKIPRLHDRYFQSRPTSDKAERGHSLHMVRLIPRSAGQFLRAACTTLLTAIAIALVEPTAAWLAIAAATAVVHQYPRYRNVTLRLLEPLGAPEQEPEIATDRIHKPRPKSDPRLTMFPDPIRRLPSVSKACMFAPPDMSSCSLSISISRRKAI